MTVPQAAIDAAYATDETWLRENLPEPELRRLLGAAAPHIAAAERDRIHQLAIDHDAVYQGSHDGDTYPFADLLTEGDPT